MSVYRRFRWRQNDAVGKLLILAIFLLIGSIGWVADEPGTLSAWVTLLVLLVIVGVFGYAFFENSSAPAYSNPRSTSTTGRNFSTETKRLVWYRDDGTCQNCGYRGPDIHYDHIIPWSKGGASTIENCQLLCERCNRSKSNHL